MKGDGTLKCEIRAYNYSPKGGVEGLQVETNGLPALVIFPPHEAAEILRSVRVGKTVTLEVAEEPESDKGPAEHPVYRLISFVPAPGETVTADGNAICGTVARFNYAKHGEANGVVLDSGDFVHLKPDGMKRAKLRIGSRVEADGDIRPMEFGGRVCEASSVNGLKIKGKH